MGSGGTVYPKIGTLFRLEKGTDGRKWVQAVDDALPDTAGLHFIPPEDVVVTEKVDGANMWIDPRWGVIGKRNGQCRQDDTSDKFYFEVGLPILDQLREQFSKTMLLQDGMTWQPGAEEEAPFGWPNVILFGELVGPKVNGSGALFDERKFLLFDVLSQPPGTFAEHFFRWSAVKDFAAAAGLDTVPELTGHQVAFSSPVYHRLFFFDYVKEGITTLDSVIRPGVPAEGVVIRDGQDTSVVRRRIAKIRRKDFRV